MTTPKDVNPLLKKGVNQMEPLIPEVSVAQGDTEPITGPVAQVTFAVLAGARSMREISKLTGLPPTTAFEHANAARVLGLIDWEHEKRGTLRPAITVTQVERL